jgi:tetratricopeptide (TPR) repeat protein
MATLSRKIDAALAGHNGAPAIEARKEPEPVVAADGSAINRALHRKHKMVQVFSICPEPELIINTAEFWKTRESGVASERQRRMRRAVVSLVALVLIMAGLSVWAVAQTLNANRHRLDADAQRLNADQQRAYAEAQRGEAEKQYGIAKDALEKAHRAQDELEKQKGKVEKERDNTKEKARLLGISEAKARQNAADAIRQKNLAKDYATQLSDIADTMNQDLYGFDALRAGKVDEAIDKFTQALDASEKSKNGSFISYNLLNIGDAYAIKGGVLQADAMKQLDAATESPESGQKLLYVLYGSMNEDAASQQTNRQQATAFYTKALAAVQAKSAGGVEATPIPFRAAALNQRLGDLYLTADLQAALGPGSNQPPDFAKAVAAYDEACKIYHDNGSFEDEALLLSRIGYITSIDSKDKTNLKSIEFYKRAEAAYSEAKKDTRDKLYLNRIETKQSAVLVRLGELYAAPAATTNDESKKTAVKYFSEAALIFVRLNRADDAAEMYLQIGDLYSALPEADAAFTNYREARELFQTARANETDETKRQSLDKSADAVLGKIAAVYKGNPAGKDKLIAYFETVISSYPRDPVGKAAALQQIGDACKSYFSDAAKGADYYARAAQAWHEAGKQREFGDALFLTAQTYQSVHDAARMLDFMNQAAAVYDQLDTAELKNTRNSLTLTLGALGKMYLDQGEKLAALRTFNTALVKAQPFKGETASFNYRISDIIQQGSKILFDLRNEEEAANFFRNAFAYYESLGATYSTEGPGQAFETAANYYAQANKPLAIQYYKRAFDFYHKRNYISQFELIRKIGRTYFESEGEKAAGAYFVDALRSYSDSNKNDRAAALSAIGQFYNDFDKHSEAISWYEQALKLRAEANDKSGQASVLRILSGIYKKLGQTDKADESARQADALLKK